MTDGFEIGFAVGDVRLNNLKHFLGGLGEFDEDAVINLKETKELQNFSGFRSHFVDTIVNTDSRKRGYPLIRTTKTSFG